MFWDADRGGYFSGAGNDSSILLRLKEDNDSAEPAASSVAALNLLRFAQIRNDAGAFARAEKTIETFAPQIAHFPSAMPQMLVALDFTLSAPRQIVIAGQRDSADARSIVAEVHRHFLPNKILLLADGAEGQRYLEEKLDALRGMKPVGGKAAGYVCENFTCQVPVTDPKALGELLRRSNQRISTNQDFTYIREDIQQFRKTQADKTVSLNEKERLKEKEELDARQKARDKERLARKESDEKIYELTMRLAALPGLPPPVAKTNAALAKLRVGAALSTNPAVQDVRKPGTTIIKMHPGR